MDLIWMTSGRDVSAMLSREIGISSPWLIVGWKCSSWRGEIGQYWTLSGPIVAEQERICIDGTWLIHSARVSVNLDELWIAWDLIPEKILNEPFSPFDWMISRFDQYQRHVAVCNEMVENRSSWFSASLSGEYPMPTDCAEVLSLVSSSRFAIIIMRFTF